MADLRLKVVTPDRVFYDDDVERVIVRGVEGDIGILKGHAPFVTLLDIHKIRIKKDGEERIAAIAGGYIDVRNDVITIVSPAVEWPEEIDVERAKKAKERAQKKLRSKSAEEMLKAEIELKKSINRLNLFE